jgi:hypothetical protein
MIRRVASVKGAIAAAIVAAAATSTPSLAAVGKAPPTIAAPSIAHGAMIASIAVPIEARSRPGSGRNVWRVGTVTSWSGEPQSLLVLGSAAHRGKEWLRVLLPIRPNGATGWIPRDYAQLSSTRYCAICLAVWPSDARTGCCCGRSSGAGLHAC